MKRKVKVKFKIDARTQDEAEEAVYRIIALGTADAYQNEHKLWKKLHNWVFVRRNHGRG